MELIRDQGFREQRGEYGSRVGGDSLDVSICNKSLIYQVGDSGLNLFLNFGAGFCHLGSCPPICSRNCDWQKWRDDQENTE